MENRCFNLPKKMEFAIKLCFYKDKSPKTLSYFERFLELSNARRDSRQLLNHLIKLGILSPDEKNDYGHMLYKLNPKELRNHLDNLESFKLLNKYVSEGKSVIF